MWPYQETVLGFRQVHNAIYGVMFGEAVFLSLTSCCYWHRGVGENLWLKFQLRSDDLMNTDRDDFFYQATMRICGNLDLELMLSDFLTFIRDYIPADALAMQVYDKKEYVVEDISVVSDPEFGMDKINLKLTPEAIAYVQEYDDEFDESGIIFNRPQHHPVGRLFWEAGGKKPVSHLCFSLNVAGQELGGITILASGYDRFQEKDRELISKLTGPLAVALANALQYREIQHLKEMLTDDNRYLNRQIYKMAGDEVIGQNFGLRDVMEMVRQVAPLSSQVLLLGETGVGKEVIANAIHHSSSKAKGPFIKVNCGAIPDSLIDSELFGHEKGAFTGALQQKRGRFERAHGGTIFLDEIGELPLEAQVRLLRVIQMHEIERVGSSEPISVDIRIIAATHRDLPEMIRKGTFREDLWFRLNVFPITIPPLRHRVMDIPALVSYFVEKKTREMNFVANRIPAPGSIEPLQAYHWPGNVRELENVVERALIRSSASPERQFLQFDELNLSPVATMGSRKTPLLNADNAAVLKIDDAMKRHIEAVLELTKGQIGGDDGAAVLLGLPPSTLRNRMKKLGMLVSKELK
jgi:transcriptional regulator with GAF, ATPase, and Fis domain